MRVVTVEVRRGHRQSCLALAKLNLEFGCGTQLKLDDVRVLQSKSGLWVGFPAFSVGTRMNPDYHVTTEFSTDAKQQISDAVLSAYRDWVESEKAADVGA